MRILIAVKKPIIWTIFTLNAFETSMSSILAETRLVTSVALVIASTSIIVKYPVIAAVRRGLFSYYHYKRILFITFISSVLVYDFILNLLVNHICLQRQYKINIYTVNI